MDLPDTHYWRKFDGRFQGLLNWQDNDQLWEKLAASSDNWYVYDLDEELPILPTNKAQFSSQLALIKEFLHARQIRPHGGFVYVDNRDKPEFVKVFDPRKMGSSCGGSGSRIYPRWTFSIITPDTPVPTDVPRPEKNFWSKLLRS